jgi:hypothetical protein
MAVHLYADDGAIACCSANPVAHMMTVAPEGWLVCTCVGECVCSPNEEKGDT